MFLDARDLADGSELDADVCIVGAGAAGITLARALRSRPLRIVVFESGGLDPEPATQALMEGESTGMPYYRLDAVRLRYFGGTTNHWVGACRPLDRHDFERRAWIPRSGWPLTLADLEPYYAQAQRVCELGPFGYDAAEWATADAPELPLRSDRFATGMLQVSPPTRFGKVYRDDLRGAANVRVYLHANLLELETGGPEAGVQRLRVGCLDGRRFVVRARYYVLAAGAIENARLLLASNRVQRGGVGNGSDLVGRCFMEHISVTGAVFLPTRPDLPLGLYEERPERGVTRTGYLMPTPEMQQRERLVNLRIFLEPATEAEVLKASASGVRAADSALEALREGRVGDVLGRHVWGVAADLDDIAMYAYRTFFHPEGPARAFYLHAHLEQAPNPDSRVTLSPARDALGIPRVRLDWEFGQLERRSLRRAYEVLAHELGAAGLGRVRLLPDGVRLEGDVFRRGALLPDWPTGVRGSYHHMGTTRMAASRAEGVVDRDCRVHGVANLFVAGSSVFPTAGSANPTLTIVALALRLADHVERILA